MNLRRIVPEPVKKLIRSKPVLINPILESFPHLREIGSRNGLLTMVSEVEGKYLAKLAERVQTGAIVELGVFSGGSLYYLAQGAGSNGNQVQIYGVDPFTHNLSRQIAEDDGVKYHLLKTEKPSRMVVEERLHETGVNGLATLIEGFSQEEAEKWNKGVINLLFIDGNHQQVEQDFYAWRPHLDEYAMVVFHNTNFPYYGRKDASSAFERLKDRENLRLLLSVESITAVQLKVRELPRYVFKS